MTTPQHEQTYQAELQTAQQEALAFTERLATAESLPGLTAAFGVEMPENYTDMSTSDQLAWLKGFSNEHLDVRKGKERQQADKVTYTPEQEAAVAAFKDEFSMEGETNASRSAYGFITELGGYGQSNLLRVRHLKKQLDSGVQAPYILLLGSARPIDNVEREKAADFASNNPQTEFDLQNAAFEHEFGIAATEETSFSLDGGRDEIKAWKMRHYELPDGTHVLSVSAPQIEGQKRANTADTYRFVREVIGKDMLHEGDSSMLLCTTDFYVPFQHADALRLLGIQAGLEVETVGYGGVDRPTQSYAGEINSAINQTYLLDKALQPVAEAA